MLEDAEVLERVHVARMESQRMAQRGFRGRQITLLEQRRAQLAVGLGQIGVDPDRLVEPHDGFLEAAGGEQVDPAVQRLDRAGGERLHLPQERVVDGRLPSPLLLGQLQLLDRLVDSAELAKCLPQTVARGPVGMILRQPDGRLVALYGPFEIALPPEDLSRPAVRMRGERREGDHPAEARERVVKPIAGAVGLGATQKRRDIVGRLGENRVELSHGGVGIANRRQHHAQVVPPADPAGGQVHRAPVVRLGRGVKLIGVVEHPEVPVGPGVERRRLEPANRLNELPPDRGLHRVIGKLVLRRRRDRRGQAHRHRPRGRPAPAPTAIEPPAAHDSGRPFPSRSSC